MKKKSLFSIFSRIQAISFLVMCIFILLEGIVLYKKATEDLVAERSMVIAGECQEIAGKMNTIEEHTFELLRSARNNYDSTWSESREERLFGLQSVSAAINEKIVLYPNMEFVYVYRPDDFMLSRRQANVRESEKLNLADFLEQLGIGSSSGPINGKWMFHKVEDVDYCGIIYYYADIKLYVGTFIRSDHLFEGLYEQFSEFQGKAQIISEEDIVYTVGTEQIETKRGTVNFADQELIGGLKVSGYFAVKMFEVFRNNILVLILGIFLMSLVSLLQQRLLIKKHIISPIIELSNSVKEAEQDMNQIQIEQTAQIAEIAALEHTLSYLMHEVVAVRMELYEQKILEQSIQLRELRAQLSPHFYLNAIMTASSMIYQNRNEETREYLSQLSAYMRYMMRISNALVNMGEELAHIENYVRMQEIKFPDSVVLILDCPENLLEKKIPHLLLHTIVENVFKHAMNLTEMLMLMISCQEVVEENFQGIQIVVEDSGKGFTEEQLKKYNEDEEEEKLDHHIGLYNIKRSLRLRYEKENLFRISNAIPHGARVELRIPEERDIK